MIIAVSGYGKIDIKNLVFDYNGTLAEGGRLIPGAGELMNELAKRYDIYVLTADTFGTVEWELADVNCRLVILEPSDQSGQKHRFITSLGKDVTAAIGNGNNDRLMLKEASLGISVIQQEGAFRGTVMESDIICRSVLDAMKLFREPERLVATLRA